MLPNTIIRIIGYALFLLALNGFRVYFRRRRIQLQMRAALAVPDLPATLPAWVDAEDAQRVHRYVEQMRSLPWGQTKANPTISHQHYEIGLAISYDAGGEFNKLNGAIDAFLECAPALSWAGAAEVMMRLSYLSGTRYVPEGLREAIGYTTLAIKANRRDPEPWLARVRLCSLYEGKQSQKLAELALSQARLIAPNQPRLALAEASYYRRMGRTSERIGALYRALAASATGQLSSPERMGTLDNLAWALMDTDAIAESIVLFDQLNAEFPNYAWGWHNASFAYSKAGRLAEALERSERALSFFEFGAARRQNILLRLRLGLRVPMIESPLTEADREEAASIRVGHAIWLLDQSGVSWNDVEYQLRLALQVMPERAETHWVYGQLLLKHANDPRLAASVLSDALRLQPSKASYWFDYARALAQSGPDQAAPAEEAFRHLMTLGNFSDVHREFGRFLFAQGPARWPEAEAEAHAALQVTPNNPENNKLLAQIMEAKRRSTISQT